jgi:hypothetical protein
VSHTKHPGPGPGLDTPWLAHLADTPVWPVFILGLHRSGTTLLYSLLAQAADFNTVTAYHLAHYDELLHNSAHGLQDAAREALTRSFAADGLADRGIDRVAATADTMRSCCSPKAGNATSPPRTCPTSWSSRARSNTWPTTTTPCW